MNEEARSGVCVGCADFGFKVRNAKGRLSSGDTERVYHALRKHVFRQMYGGNPDRTMRGRGRRLKGIVGIQRSRGRKGNELLTQEIYEATGRWLRHLVERGVRFPESLRAHLTEAAQQLDEEGVGEDLLRAFDGVKHRFQTLGTRERALDALRAREGKLEALITAKEDELEALAAREEELDALIRAQRDALKTLRARKGRLKALARAREDELDAHIGIEEEVLEDLRAERGKLKALIRTRRDELRALIREREGEPRTPRGPISERERKVEQARKACMSKTATLQALASLAHVGVEAVRKAEREGWPAAERGDHHDGVGIPASKPGAGRVIVDVEEFNRRLHHEED